jgi:transcriptional regulator with XRE-family HTH domain
MGRIVSPVETRQDWSRRVAALVGRQVAYYRTRIAVFTGPGPDLQQQVIEPMTLQELSDRCTKLGYPIARSVISKLEKGHRQTVTVDEVQILAAALHVPPVLLLFPLGQAQQVEVLPDVVVHPWDAIRWYSGELPATSDSPDFAGRDAPLTLFSLHHHLVDEWNADQAAFAEAVREVREAKTPEARRDAEENVAYRRELAAGARGYLLRIRGTMHGLGYLPPELPPDIARALGEEAGSDGPR